MKSIGGSSDLEEQGAQDIEYSPPSFSSELLVKADLSGGRTLRQIKRFFKPSRCSKSRSLMTGASFSLIKTISVFTDSIILMYFAVKRLWILATDAMRM